LTDFLFKCASQTFWLIFTDQMADAVHCWCPTTSSV